MRRTSPQNRPIAKYEPNRSDSASEGENKASSQKVSELHGMVGAEGLPVDTMPGNATGGYVCGVVD